MAGAGDERVVDREPAGVRVGRPSRFGVVALVVLLLLGCVLNLYVAFDGPGVDSYRWPDLAIISIHSDEEAAAQYWWPSVPDEAAHLGKPSSWVHVDEVLIRSYSFDLGYRNPSKEVDYTLHEKHFGWPFTVRATKEVVGFQHTDWNAGGTVWPVPPEGEQHGPLAITYRPLGLILNPVIYAIPIWVVVMVTEWVFIAMRRERRNRLGLCGVCTYEIGGLSICPECGTASTDWRMRSSFGLWVQMLVALLALSMTFSLAMAWVGLKLGLIDQEMDEVVHVIEDQAIGWPHPPESVPDLGDPGLGYRWDHWMATHYEIEYEEPAGIPGAPEVYHQARFAGWPAFTLRSDRVSDSFYSGTVHYPAPGQWWYRVLPFGLMLNTLLYTLPVWVMLLCVRQVLIYWSWGMPRVRARTGMKEGL